MFSLPFDHREQMMSSEFPHIGHGHSEYFESPRGGRGGHFHGHGHRHHRGGPPGFGIGPHAELFAGRGRGGRGGGGFRHGGRGRHSASESDGDEENAELIERFREMGHGRREHGHRGYHRERDEPAGDETPKGYAVESDSEGFVDVNGDERKDNDGETTRETPGERGWGRHGHHGHGRHSRGFGAERDDFDFAPCHGGRGGMRIRLRREHGPHAFMMRPPPHGPDFHHHHPGRHGHFKKPFPRVDILTSETQYVLEIEIPGVRKEDINALVGNDGQSITVEGTFPSRAENTLERVYVERRLAEGEKFARTIPLAGPVDKENIVAKLSDGVLTVTLVKVKLEEPKGMAVSIA